MQIYIYELLPESRLKEEEDNNSTIGFHCRKNTATIIIITRAL